MTRIFNPMIVFIFLILLYWFAEGATEGYTWADSEQRMENVIIKGGSDGAGVLDYHGWRFMEILGTHGAILIAVLFSIVYSYIWVGVGSMLVGMFLYERVLNYVINGTIYKEPGWIFYIAGIEIPRYFWQDILLLLAGIGLIVFGLIKYYDKEA